MLIDPNITSYIHSLERGNPRQLEELRAFAEKEGVPIIRREMESFIRVLFELKKPERILEIGAGVGYSSIFFAFNTPAGCSITTIENFDERVRQCGENIKAFSLEDRIKLISGDASEVLKEFTGPYDFIFLDAAKAQYITMLPDILRLLEPGGVLLADNILQEGHLIESRYITPRRQRTIHERMREFVWEVKHSPELESAVITIGDGVTLSVKK